MKDQDEVKPLSFREMLQSILAGALGVQSGKNRNRDFSRGKAHHFIVLGLVFTALFTLTLVGIVKLVLYFATH